MKRTKSILGLFFVLASLQALGQEIIQPSIKSKTTFAIVVDQNTYEAAKEEIKAYKHVLENDGLGTYIIYDNWTKPDQIREILRKLYKDKSAPLEGTVLVGKIPIPMLRDGQHLTSAFKMSQKIRWDKSSVPSDRFYDDFDLQFEYLKQDTTKGRELYHYYSLKAESPQFIGMDIYSARIKPPIKEGESMTQKIKDYLTKVVRLRAQRYVLDDMVVSTGHGYNSNSVNAVLGEAIALKSQFPTLFKPGGSIKFLNYRSQEFIKFNLLSELKRQTVDFAYMTGHGTPTLQLMNGYPETSSPQPSMLNVARYIRSKMRSAKEDGRDLDQVKENFKKSLGLSDKWFEDAFDPKSIEQDSIYNLNMDIQISDIKDAGIQAKLVYINSCLTGSFHLEDYLAGYYPFSKNENITAVANSVGVLQDLYPSELMGLLGKGYRIGNWLKHIAYLETHILGDPTFYFHTDGAKALNEATVLNNNVAYWKKLLKEDDASFQALALEKLSQLLSEKEVSPILRSYYFNSHYESVRMQAFQLLSHFENKDYFEVLHAAKNDSYEYIRRRAVYDLTDLGATDFIRDLIQFYILDAHSERVLYRARWALQFMDPVIAKQEINLQIRENKALYGGKELADKLEKEIDYNQAKLEKLKKIITDRSAAEKERLSELTSLRLYRHHSLVPEMINLAISNEESELLRITVLEALGWYTLSYQRNAIIEGCEAILKSDAPDAVKKEALKTKNRIKGNSHKL